MTTLWEGRMARRLNVTVDLRAAPWVTVGDLEGRLRLKNFYLLLATADRLKDPVRDV
jgi:hypothetical protein